MLTIKKVTTSAIIAASALSIGFNSFATSAVAASISYSDDTTGQPTWTPPLSSATIPYSVQHFTVDTAGTYTFTSIVPGRVANPILGQWYRQLYLYANSFNSLSPISNLINGQGSLNATLTTNLSTNFQNLVPGTSYFLVTSGFFSSGDVGSFTNSISIPGAGNITLSSGSATAVPEPFSVLGSIIGGSAALRMRRKFLQQRKHPLD
jgi:hypothetical protein